MWISFEGINGVGKTYLLQRVAQILPCRLISELTDTAASELPGQIIDAMSRGQTFLRTGHPLTETLALLALKVREYEEASTYRGLILEDRGVDTVAVYQAVILGDSADLYEVADRVHRAAARFMPLPDRTILLTDDFETCVGRYERRSGAPMSSQDRALVARAAELYVERADRAPGRFVVLDRRGRTEDDVVLQLCRLCTDEEAA